MYDIEFYEDKNGRSEVYEYIKELKLNNNNNNNKFILLSVFMKQTPKTPRREIEKAKKFLEDYRYRSD